MLIGIVGTLTIDDSSAIEEFLCKILMALLIIFLCLLLLCTIVVAIAGVVLAFVLVFATCLVIAATGAYGIAFVKLYNEMYPENQISKMHYILQVLPCLDVVSSIILLRKYKISNLS